MAISDKRKESMYNYAKKNLKRIPLDVQKEKYEEIKAAATAAGESVNGYIKKSCRSANGTRQRIATIIHERMCSHGKTLIYL